MRIGQDYSSMTQLATMKRINSAADDAAGLAISQTLTAQVNGYDTASSNIASFSDASSTAGGALGNIQDQLQRMRELAVQASNGIYTASDKQSIQNEISQLKNGIADVARNTEFNTIKLLDGTFTDKSMATTPYGTGRTMSVQNASLAALGIENFDVTGSFDIADIDNAISRVSDAQSQLGASDNASQFEMSINAVSSENLQAATSRIEDTDLEKTLMEMKTQQIMEQYQTFSQKNLMAQKASVLNLLK